MKHTYMAIGAHIGDCELQNGLTLATLSKRGHKIVTVALTKGERGNPKDLTVLEYSEQKVKEANEFASMLNGEAVILNYRDSEIPDNEKIRLEGVA